MDLKAATEKALRIVTQAPKWGVCSYGTFNDKHEKYQLDDACHARIGVTTKNLQEKSWYFSTVAFRQRTEYKTKEEQQLLLMFTNFLLDDKGPWKGIVKDREKAILEVDGLVYGFVIEIYPDDNINLLTHLSIAARIAEEHVGSYRVFCDLVRTGMNPAEAYFVSGYFNGAASGSIIKRGFNTAGHSVFDRQPGYYESTLQVMGYVGPVINIKNFVEGTPVLPETLTLKEGVYKAVNKIFYLPKQSNIKHIDEVVEMSGVVKGRWTVQESMITIPNLMKAWEGGYRDQLYSLAA